MSLARDDALAVIEPQRVPAVSDTLGTAYKRTRFLEARKVMLQEWVGDRDTLKAGAEVIPLNGSAA
jgi:hypothetical protein